MASLCLTNSVLETGVEWSGTPALARALGDPERPAVLLYPSPGARDVAVDPPPGPVTLIAVDGTWRQAKQLIARNPELAALPRYTFTPSAPSDYRIRKEPDIRYVSTIEALMHVLGLLEGDPERFASMLAPFRAMIDHQIAFEASQRHVASRHKRRRRREHRGPELPRVLVERAEDLVCVVGEANAWPRRRVADPASYPDELVHWLAYRWSTGERFEIIAAPTHPLARRIPEYIDLPADRIEAGRARADWHSAWRAFRRPTDLLCAWGTYATGLLRDELEADGEPAAATLDLRQVARAYLSRRLGGLEEYVESTDLPRGPALGVGRGGRRLADLVAVTNAFVALARSRP